MKENVYNLYQHTRNGIFRYENLNEDERLVFLNEYMNERQQGDIVFEYCNEIFLKNTDKKIMLGKILDINPIEKTITVNSHKEYIPYYNETKTIEKYYFEDVGFDNPIDILIVKFIKFTNNEKKKIDGVYNFPKYIIMNSKSGNQKEKICQQLDINEKSFTYDKYKKIVEKYKILLNTFYEKLK